jgi:hypothetical protein
MVGAQAPDEAEQIAAAGIVQDNIRCEDGGLELSFIRH